MEAKDAELERYGDKLLAHGNSGEPERLAIGARAWDPTTIGLLEELRLSPDSRCLEAGAGLGTIASWLAGHCPQGKIVATDINTSLLHQHAAPGVEILQHDLVREDFPPGSFDLIHARSVLSNLREREAVLAKMVSWLAPGGVILIEDPTVELAGSSPDLLYRTVTLGTLKTAEKVMGTDMTDWPRSFPRPLQRAGLVDVGLHVQCEIAAKGSPAADFLRMSVVAVAPRMLADGLITAEELEEYVALLESPDFIDIGLVTVAMWGTAPG